MLRRADHATIYGLIAGSYTPVALVAVGGAVGWVLFVVAWQATHDGDANRLVEASRQRDAADRGCTAGGGEGQRLRALAFSEEPLPAPRLEGVGEEKEDAGRDHQERVGARKRPARMDEVQHGQRGRREGARHKDGVEGDTDAA